MKSHRRLTQLLQHLVTLIQDKVLQVLQGKLLGPDESKNPVQRFVKLLALHSLNNHTDSYQYQNEGKLKN